MTRAVLIPVDGPPELVDIPGEDVDLAVFRYLMRTFPGSFDGIRLGQDVIGYVSDVGLLDGSPWNPGAQALADSVYLAVAGRTYHTPIAGPMVVLGVREHGASTSVTSGFLDTYLPDLAPDLAAGATS